MSPEAYRYQADAINTATPEQLTLMLYRAALSGLRTFKDVLKNNPSKGLSESQLPRDILAALADNVNMDHPEGDKLRDLYLYCWQTLLNAALSGSEDELDAVEAVLENLIQGLEGFNANRRGADPFGGRSQSVEAVSINFSG